MDHVNYTLIIIAAIIAIASPGPAILAILGMSMKQGRRHGLALASGVLTGSLIWSVLAAFGLGTLMHANAWLAEVFRYAAAGYLLILSYSALRSAVVNDRTEVIGISEPDLKAAYTRGLLIHLLNPKAILFFGSLYSLGVPGNVSAGDLIRVIGMVGIVSSSIFIGYALLFSIPWVRDLYSRSKRGFELTFCVFFGMAGISMIANRLGN